MQKKAVRLIALLLLLIFVLKSSPTLLEGIEGPGFDALNSGTCTIARNIAPQASSLLNDNRKPSFQPTTVKIYGLFELHIYYGNYSHHYFSQKGPAFDFRRKIGHAISHYFHGSKYKDSTLAI